jgi:hypothetical protein
MFKNNGVKMTKKYKLFLSLFLLLGTTTVTLALVETEQVPVELLSSIFR